MLEQGLLHKSQHCEETRQMFCTCSSNTIPCDMTILGDPFSIPKLQRHFEKKSVNILLKHQLYDCMINFLKSAQPPVTLNEVTSTSRCHGSGQWTVG